MTSSQTTDAVQNDAAHDARPLTAPAGLNLLDDANAGGCCGGGACAAPGE